MDSRAHIVCPLEFERRALLRAGLDEVAHIHCCGPGAAGVAGIPALVGPSADGPLILAGVAGGLSPDLAAGTAHVITGVRDPDRDDLFEPSLAGDAPACIVTSATATVATTAGKQALAAATAAHLVDLESVPFARLARERGWRWGVVRGVGEDAATDLPAGIDRWVDESGRVRSGPLVASLCRDPRLLPLLRRLKQDGEAALAEVARLVRVLVT